MSDWNRYDPLGGCVFPCPFQPRQDAGQRPFESVDRVGNHRQIVATETQPGRR